MNEPGKRPEPRQMGLPFGKRQPESAPREPGELWREYREKARVAIGKTHGETIGRRSVMRAENVLTHFKERGMPREKALELARDMYDIQGHVVATVGDGRSMRAKSEVLDITRTPDEIEARAHKLVAKIYGH